MFTPVAAASLRSGRINTEKWVYVSNTVRVPDRDGSGNSPPAVRKPGSYPTSAALVAPAVGGVAVTPRP